VRVSEARKDAHGQEEAYFLNQGKSPRKPSILGGGLMKGAKQGSPRTKKNEIRALRFRGENVVRE